MKIRARLIILVALSLLPVLVFCTVVATIFWRQQRLAFEERYLERVRAMAMALDRQLAGSIMLLQGLATANELDTSALATFHNRATRVARLQRDWSSLTLIEPDSGRELLDLNRPVGKPALFPLVSSPAFQRAVRDRVPVVSGLVSSPNDGLRVHLFVPVLREGSVPYVLHASMDQKVWLNFLSSNPVEPGATMSLVDSDGVIIARTLNNERWAGYRLTPEQLTRTQGAPDASSRSLGLEGQWFYTARSRSELAGWTIGIGVPVESVEASLWWSSFGILLGVGLSLLLAIALAVGLGTGITKPVTSLVNRVRALASGEAIKAPRSTGLEEVDRVAEAFVETSRMLADQQKERAALLERERAARTEAEAARAEAEAGNRAKDEFLAMLGHELRNPIGAIGTAAYVLEMPGTDEGRSAARAVIKRQVEQLGRLVNDLLEASRIATGKIVLDRHSVDLGVVVKRSLATVSKTAQGHDHEIDADVEPVWVFGDEARLEQVVINLLTNACKYTPKGGRISVRLAREADDALLEVKDTGVGIPADVLPRIFELFVQGERTLDRAQGGLGVGLTLAQRVVHLHGGTIRAESAGHNHGSTFTVRLPGIEVPAVRDTAAPLTPTATGHRILVIEDNEDARDMLRDALAAGGNEVFVAADGATGVEEAVRLDPAVACIDIGLPGLDGYAVARRIRDVFGAKPKLIALTGYGRGEDRQRALDAGFDLHLAKPVDPVYLLQVIADLVRT